MGSNEQVLMSGEGSSDLLEEIQGGPAGVVMVAIYGVIHVPALCGALGAHQLSPSLHNTGRSYTNPMSWPRKLRTREINARGRSANKYEVRSSIHGWQPEAG